MAADRINDVFTSIRKEPKDGGEQIRELLVIVAIPSSLSKGNPDSGIDKV